MSCKIYVASLADYNAGALHGVWIDDLDIKDGEQVLEEVKVMLAGSKEPIAEEWAIHDHEGFGSVMVTEGSRFDELCTMAALIKTYGHIPVAQAYEHEDEPEEMGDWIDSHYAGTYESPEDYAEEFHSDCGTLRDVPEFITGYIDWRGVARDMGFDGYEFVQESWKTCHVFRP